MKRLTTLVAMALSLLAVPSEATEEKSTYATAAEFGAPALNMEIPQYLEPTQERTWYPRGEEPFRAMLSGISGTWGNRVNVHLTTPTGRKLALNITSLSDADAAYVRRWYESNRFETIESYMQGRFAARILSAAYTQSGENIIALVVKANGETMQLIVPNEEMGATKAKTSPNLYIVTPETLHMLQRYAELPVSKEKAHLPVAENVNEALLYSHLRGSSIVLIMLNRRGSEADVAFRYYIQQHPQVVAEWAERHVFLLAYCNEEGFYTEDFHHDLTLLNQLHGTQYTFQEIRITDELSYMWGCDFAATRRVVAGYYQAFIAMPWAVYIPRLHNMKPERSFFHN